MSENRTQRVNRPQEPDDAETALAVRQQDAMAIATTRAAQEVQAAMVIAKKFPRDVIQAERRIVDACKRPILAEQAMYAYPRGGTAIEGPSIRLAEVLAQNWGNLDTGIIELEQADGESTMMAYCWDLETNTRQTKIFAVRHERHTKNGVTKLTDPRDIYEMTANQGSRRQRACILGVIPGDIVDRAIAQCNTTLQGNQAEPLADRIKKLLVAFEGLSVTKTMIETRLGHRLDTINETEYITFRKIWKAITDNMQTVESYFGPGANQRERAVVDVDAALGKTTEKTTVPGGTAATAPQPKTKEKEKPVVEEAPPEPTKPAPVETKPEPAKKDSPAADPAAEVLGRIKAAWAREMRKRHNWDEDAPAELVDEQIEDFVLNHWAKRSLDDVVANKPAWLDKFLGYLNATPCGVPAACFDFHVTEAPKETAAPVEQESVIEEPAKPNRPGKK